MSVKKAILDIILWRGFNFLSVFILNVLLARILEASQSGALFFFINNLSFVILLLSFSLESGLGFYCAEDKTGRKPLALLALFWSLAATVISFLLFDTLAGFLAPLNEISSKTAAVFFIGGNLLISFFTSFFYAKENFIFPNAILLATNVILIIFFLVGMQNLVSSQWLQSAYFAGFFIQGLFIAVFYFFKIKAGATKKLQPGDLKKIISFSSKVFLGNIIFFFVYRIDYWFVEAYSSPEELGNYIQVSKWVQWMLLLPVMIGTVLFPLTAKGRDKEIVHKVIALSRMLFIFYFAFCLVISVTGYWLFTLLFGATYTSMYPVFLLQVPGILALAGLYPVSSYHAGISRADINVTGSLFALIVIIILNGTFTPAYGIYAASVASSAGYLVYCVFSFYKFKRQHQVTLSDFFKPVKSDVALLKSLIEKKRTS